LLVVASADDPAIFVGVVAMWASAGWHIQCLRVKGANAHARDEPPGLAAA
jgi:hypothetical protein